jgi:transposase
MNLFGAELVAIDGAKFKAVNNPRRHYTQEQLQELVGKVEARIEECLAELDGQDAAAEGVAGAPSRAALQEKIAQLRQRRGRYDELRGALAAAGQSEVSLTDGDSRGMLRVGVGYNVQVAVDARHDLIVEQKVVQAANDMGQLSGMAVATKAALEVEHLNVVADAGYHEMQQLEACEAAGVETYVPAPGRCSGQSRNGRKVYPKEQFTYDATRDCYRCPQGQELARCRTRKREGRTVQEYANRAACRGCGVRAQCTVRTYRVLERQAARVAAHPEWVARRKEIVEHVFGTMRNWWHDSFLMKGLEKVRAEFSLSALRYNMRRVLNVVGVEGLLAALRASDAQVC